MYAWLTPHVMEKKRIYQREYWRNPINKKKKLVYNKSYRNKPDVRKKYKLHKLIYSRVKRGFPYILPTIFANDKELSLDEICIRIEERFGEHFFSKTIENMIMKYKNKLKITIIEPMHYRLSKSTINRR